MPDTRRTPRAPRPRGRGAPRRSTGRTVPVPEVPGVLRRPRLTGRAAILVLVLAVLTVSYASSLRAYLQQRSQIDDLKSQIALREASISDLEREKDRWQDPAYVEQQARGLNYVMPGETSYVVLDEDGKPLQQQSSLTDPATVAEKAPTAWWSTAWQSVELAGHPPEPTPPPASKIDERKAARGEG